MGLESRYRDSFSKSQKGKGCELFEQRAVSYIQGNDSSVDAEVIDGDELYEVTLNCPNNELKINCGCTPTSNKPCEHIWASLLASENLELLKNGSKRGSRLFATAASKKSIPKRKIQNDIPVLIYSPLSSTTQSKNEDIVDKEILFVVNKSRSNWLESCYLEFYWRPINQTGPIKPYSPDSINTGVSQNEKSILGKVSKLSSSLSQGVTIKLTPSFLAVIESIYEAQRLYTRTDSSQFKFAKVKERVEEDIDWKIKLNSEGYELTGLCNNEPLENLCVISDGFILLPRTLVMSNIEIYKPLFTYITENGFHISACDAEHFLEKYLLPTNIPLEDLPGRLKCTRESGLPRGHLFIRTALFKFRDKEQLHADLSFHYSGKNIPESHISEEVLDFYNSTVFKRNFPFELKLKERLKELGFRFNEESRREEFGWKIIPSRLPEIVDILLKEEWLLIAEGKSYKAPQSFQLRLSSGADWFELEGEATFGDEKIIIPELMTAAKKGERYVQLGDGSYGVLPEEWLKHYTVLTQLGELVGDSLRFRKSQGLIIEYLLQELLESTEPVRELIKGIEESTKINNVETPQGFKGELRPYQKQGLSWLKFLRKIGVGGILADDMGLGKTIQILALLTSIKDELENTVLLVVPRSLIFNWIEEVRKFTPDLTVMEYSGSSRKQLIKQFNNYNIVITTYGTVRQDIEKLSKEFFEYCILDEAQAIKNRDSSTHKALRLIKAKNRISMSGTPVENSLSDLVSQFEFLNPGITGHGKIASLIEGNEKLNKDTLKKLREAFKPFILRRTKGQVAKDLPPKTEQIIYCEMDYSQKSMYDRMLKFYQQEMAKKEKDGQSNIEYLGALTRLRQMACHPLLVADEWTEQSSAKLEVLLEKLKEIISEGHRVLVFSQFTSFLSLIKKEVEKNEWQYCYLDGKTCDRQGEVEKFQKSEIPLFLISLKAGGVGLNLTAADYVFIMDPWWNPAIENQAIDRAYRIGQQKHVIACKLISRGTVEEKVLKMQRVKKYLADSIVDEDNEMLDKLTVEDFKQLLT